MELFHKDKFKDVKDVLIRGTKTRVGRAQQNEQLVAWMKRTNRIPLSYMRESNGIHVECSELFERKIRHALENGSAIGLDGGKYLFKDTDDLFPIGSDICVMTPVYGYMNVYKNETNKVLVGGVVRATLEECIGAGKDAPMENLEWFCVARVELLDEEEGGGE